MTQANSKPTLPGCSVLPPMTPGRTVAENSGAAGKAKGKPARRKAGGRFAVLNAFIDFTMRELSRAEIVVWLILFRDTKAADGLARTSQADMARRAGLNARTVKRAVGSLQRRRLLRVVRRGGLRQGPSACRVYPLPDVHKGTPATP